MLRGYRVYCLIVPTVAWGLDAYGTGVDRAISGWDTGAIFQPPEVPAAIVNAIMNNPIMNNDMKVRLLRLLSAIETCIDEDSYIANGNAPVKHVFLAPEFYFRPQRDAYTDGGEYSLAQFQELGRVLQDFFQNYPQNHSGIQITNWLFLCGTCIYNSAVPPVRQLKNTMLAYMVTPQGARQVHVRKLCTSHIDGISPGEDFNGMQDVLVATGPGEVSMHYFPEFRLFVEICLESYLQLMQNHFDDSYDPVEAHVICAAGLPSGDSRTFLGSHAVFIRDDGYLDDTGNMATFYDDETLRTTNFAVGDSPFVAQWSDYGLTYVAGQQNLVVQRADLLPFAPVIRRIL